MNLGVGVPGRAREASQGPGIERLPRNGVYTAPGQRDLNGGFKTLKGSSCNPTKALGRLNGTIADNPVCQLFCEGESPQPLTDAHRRKRPSKQRCDREREKDSA